MSIKILLSLLVVLMITGCASSRVNVDMDSCQSRGVIDGIKIFSCDQVKVVK